MINFFRKIRKKYANDNRPIKYVRYAIGEIVLVVIGILIALQINNWNQNRLNSKEEIILLNAISKKMETNLFQQSIGVSRYENIINAAEQLIMVSSNSTVYPTSEEIYQNLNSITKRFLVGKSNTTNIYDELITSGKFNLLKSKELRNELTAFNLNLQLLASYEDLQNNFVDNHLSPFLNDNINKLEILAKKDSIDLFLYGKTLKFDFSNLPKNINPSHNIFLKNEKFTNLLVELIEHTERLLPIYDRLGKSISKIDSLVINKIH